MIYDIDYDQCINDLYPTNKRLPIMLNKEYALMSGVSFIQKLHSYFIFGTIESNYDSTINYAFGSLVIFQRKVYYRNEIVEGYAIGQNPTTSYWSLALNDFIGASEKAYFGPGKMVLEYALNRIFQTTFRQPIGISPPNSDIYIVNNITNQPQFYIGIDDSESSYVVLNDTEANQYITYSDLDSTIKNFSVMAPNAVLIALDSDPVKAKAIIGSVVTRYKLSGYTFNVIGY